MALDKEILSEFQLESKILITQMQEILDKCEEDFTQVKRLEEFGQTVDRIMGGAKSLAVASGEQNTALHKLGDYAAVCKAVGYKASQITDNEQFYKICVGLLMDAVDVLEKMMDNMADPNPKEISGLLSQPFLDRLKWVSDKFGAEYRASVDPSSGSKTKKMSQSEIDMLLKKLGMG
jgi:hypothetical protein